VLVLLGGGVLVGVVQSKIFPTNLNQSKPTQTNSNTNSTGVLYALVNAGFGVGVGLSGLLPPGLPTSYAASAIVGTTVRR
jgi:hypothetical protein